MANRSSQVSITLGILMLTGSALAWFMTPSTQGVTAQARIDLETMIPLEFDSWKVESAALASIVNPDDQGLVVKIYDQTLSRTYKSSSGDRVMLSIAYGRNQSTDLHVHRPEICYATSGFEVGEISKTTVNSTIGRIPVMQLVAKHGARIEPITYWIRVGDSLTRGWIEQKVAAIGYGLSRKVPDGLLFRISSISSDEHDAYRIQQAFLLALLKEVKIEDRYLLVGRLAQ